MIDVDGDVYDVDIELPALDLDFAVGEGLISGVFDFPEMPFRAADFYCEPWLRDDEESYCEGGLSNVGVLLLNATKQRLLGFALTDATGAFRFGSLPFGSYHVMSDVPRFGRGTCEEIVLSPEQPQMKNLHLFINESGRVAMRKNGAEMTLPTFKVFPNPAKDEIVLSGLESLENYTITIRNLVGNMVLPQSLVQSDMVGECVLSVCDLPSGVYFIALNGRKGNWMTKFIKY